MPIQKALIPTEIFETQTVEEYNASRADHDHDEVRNEHGSLIYQHNRVTLLLKILKYSITQAHAKY